MKKNDPVTPNEISSISQKQVSSFSSQTRLDLAGTQWKILDFNGEKISGYINFTDKNLALKLCNLINANYTQTEQNIKITEKIGTKMYCENAEMKAENAFSRAENFVLKNENGKTKLTFGADFLTIVKEQN